MAEYEVAFQHPLVRRVLVVGSDSVSFGVGEWAVRIEWQPGACTSANGAPVASSVTHGYPSRQAAERAAPRWVARLLCQGTSLGQPITTPMPTAVAVAVLLRGDGPASDHPAVVDGWWDRVLGQERLAASNEDVSRIMRWGATEAPQWLALHGHSGQPNAAIAQACAALGRQSVGRSEIPMLAEAVATYRRWCAEVDHVRSVIGMPDTMQMPGARWDDVVVVQATLKRVVRGTWALPNGAPAAVRIAPLLPPAAEVGQRYRVVGRVARWERATDGTPTLRLRQAQLT